MKLSVFLFALLMAVSCRPAETVTPPQPDEPVYSRSYSLMGRIESPGVWQDGEILLAFVPGGKTPVGKAYLTAGAGTQAGTFDLKTDLPAGEKVVLKRDVTIAASQRQDAPDVDNTSRYAAGQSGSTELDEDWPAEFLLSQDYSLIRIIPVAGSFHQGERVAEIGFRCNDAGLSDEGDAISVSLSSPLVLSTGGQAVSMVVKPVDIQGKECFLDILGYHFPFLGVKLERGAVNLLKVVFPDAVLIPGTDEGPEYSSVSVAYKRAAETTTYDAASAIPVNGMNRLPKYTVDPTDRWGGYAGVKPDSYVSTNTAGYWRTGKYKGRWVCVNPDGNVTLLHGINGAAPYTMKESSSSSSPERAEYNKKFSSLADWAQFTHRFLSGHSFNFFSTNPKRIRVYRNYMPEAEQALLRSAGGDKQLSQVEILYLLRTFSWDYSALTGKSFDASQGSVFTLMFDPLYLDFIDELAKDGTALFRDDKAFIGYYIDNELGFRFTNASTPAIYLKQWLALDTSSSSPRAFAFAKQYAEDFMRNNYHVEPLAGNVTTAMDDAFLADICDYYYRTAAAAIRKYDPNHLVLGSRLHGTPKTLKRVHEACARYCDAVSVNVYSVWEPNDSYFISQFKVWVNDSKPCLVTEFYTRDALATFDGQAYGNTGEGGGWIVKGQAARGLHYQNFTRKLLSYSHCIGWQWFQMTDDFSEVYGWNNKGVINPAFEYYTDLTDRMRQLHWNIYQIMDYYSASGASSQPAADLHCVYWE